MHPIYNIWTEWGRSASSHPLKTSPSANHMLNYSRFVDYYNQIHRREQSPRDWQSVCQSNNEKIYRNIWGPSSVSPPPTWCPPCIHTYTCHPPLQNIIRFSVGSQYYWWEMWDSFWSRISQDGKWSDNKMMKRRVLVHWFTLWYLMEY